MALGTPYNLGTINTKSSTTEVITTVSAVTAGDSVFVAFISSAAATITSVVDNSGGGNTYTLVSSVVLNNTAANGTLYIYADYSHSGMASGQTITVTASTAVLMSASAWAVSGISAATLVTGPVTAFGSSTAPTATRSGLTAGTNYLAFGVVGTAGPSGDTFTQATNFATPPVRVGTTGGNATTNRTVAGGYDAFTGVTSITYNPTITSRPWGEILLVYTAAPNVITANITESGTATDAQTATYTLGGATITESANALDSETATKSYDVSITESVTADATDDAAFVIFEDVAESVTATETSSAEIAYSASTTETVTADTTQASQLDAFASTTETVTATDSESATADFQASQTESVTATDSETATLDQSASQTESVTATESEDSILQYGVSISESVTADTTQTNKITANAFEYETNNTRGSISFSLTNSASITATIAVKRASRFLAQSSGSIKTVQIYGITSSLVNNGTFDVEIWQLSSNSPTGVPQTLIGTKTLSYKELNRSTTAQTWSSLDISSANISVTAGTYYALALGNPTFSAGSFDWSIYDSPNEPTTYNANIAAGAITGTLYFNGTTWLTSQKEIYANNLYLTNNTTDAESVNVDWQVSQSETALAIDSENAVFAFPVDITETLTATDTEDANFSVFVSESESVTATDSQNYTWTTSGSVTETVTADTTQTNVLSANANATDPNVIIDTAFGGGTANALGAGGGTWGISFTASKTTTLYSAIIAATRGATIYADPFLELYQGTTLVASTTIPYASLSQFSSTPLLPINLQGLGFNLTAGLNYSLRINATGTTQISRIYWQSTSTSFNPRYYNLSVAAGVSPYPTPTSPDMPLFKLIEGVATDAEVGGLSTTASQSESVTATDVETTTLDQTANITETVTAVESEDAILQYGVFQNESVTANDSETNTLTANAWITEANNAPLVATNIFGTGAYSNLSIVNGSTAARGINFVANQTSSLGVIQLRASRTNTTASLPTQPGTIELWKLTTNTTAGVPQTLLASVSFDISTFGVNSDVLTILDFSGVSGASITTGLGYSIVLRAGSDWTLSTQYLIWNSASTSTGRNGLNYFSNLYVSIRATTGSNWAALNQDTQYQIAIQPPTATLDTETVNVDWQVAQSESALALDSEDAVYAISVDRTETVTATDTEDSNAAMGVAQDESVTALDSEDCSLAYEVDTTETVTATETQENTLDANAQQNETVTATDSEESSAAFEVQQDEVVTATESNVVYVDFTSEITETLSLTDSQSAVSELPAYITEAVAANDECDYQGDAIFTVSGVQADTFIGAVSFVTDQILNVTGLQATGFTGSVSTTISVNVFPTGVYGTGQLGTAGTQGEAQVYVTGVVGSGQIGTVSLITNNFIDVTGVQGTTALGVVTASISSIVSVTGVQGITQLGTVDVEINADVYAIGVQADIILNKVNVWGNINPGPSNPWNNVNDSQTSNWVIIDKAA